MQRVADPTAIANRHAEIHHHAIVGAAVISGAIGRQRGGDVADIADVEQFTGRQPVTILRPGIPIGLVRIGQVSGDRLGAVFRHKGFAGGNGVQLFLAAVVALVVIVVAFLQILRHVHELTL
ncbi:hypothetical protein D3C78_901590 [compost metagenome]